MNASRTIRVALLAGIVLAAASCSDSPDESDPDHTGASVAPSATVTNSTPAGVTPTGVPANAIASTAFGMHINRIAPAVWPTVPIGSVRIWTPDSTWNAIEPSPGAWSFAALDQRVAQSAERSASVLLVLAMPPAWAASRPDLKGYGGGSPSPPNDIEQWRAYVSEVATRYKGRIEGYEIWNEPNLPQFFVGTPTDLAELTKVASEAIRAADPAAKVVSAGFSARTQGSEPYFQAYVAAGIADAIDVVGIHIYPYPPAGPESMVALAARFRSLADGAGLADKPMWNTEIGYGHTPESVFTGAAAASLILRTYLVLPANGIDRNYWYAWDERKFIGVYMIGPDIRTATESATAFALAERWLVGASVQSCAAVGSLWTCQVVVDGSNTQIVWSLGADVDVPSPVGTTIAYTFTGTSAPVVAGGTVRVGVLPVLLAPTNLPTIDG